MPSLGGCVIYTNGNDMPTVGSPARRPESKPASETTTASLRAAATPTPAEAMRPPTLPAPQSLTPSGHREIAATSALSQPAVAALAPPGVRFTSPAPAPMAYQATEPAAAAATMPAATMPTAAAAAEPVYMSDRQAWLEYNSIKTHRALPEPPHPPEGPPASSAGKPPSASPPRAAQKGTATKAAAAVNADAGATSNTGVARPSAAKSPLPRVRNIVDVRAGETLELLSRRHGVTVSALLTANNLTSSDLVPGQKLIIPLPAEQTAKAGKAAKSALPATKPAS